MILSNSTLKPAFVIIETMRICAVIVAYFISAKASGHESLPTR